MGAERDCAPISGSDPIDPSLLPATASIDQSGRLSVGGVDLVDLAEEVGTPVFVYDELHLRQRCQEARSAWPDGAAYASKAFLCKEMAHLVHEEGLSIDVSTGGEMHTALAGGVPPQRLVLHGNNKSEAELERALEVGVGRIVVDSFDEIDRLSRLTFTRQASAGGARATRDVGNHSWVGQGHPEVLIRVTPGVEAHTHEFIQTGMDDSKFGFSLASGEAAEAARRLEAVGGVDLVGIHAHIGSQIFRLDAFELEVERMAGLLATLEEFKLTEICVGGGLGVPYINGESAPSITKWAETVHAACERAGVPRGVRVTAEPGRSIAAAAAITLYRVGTIKKLPGIRTYVAVDGGMSDNPRPVLYGSGYEAFLPRAAGARRPFKLRVVGKHCESGDVLVDEGWLPEDVAVGDVLATPVTGAYGYSMSSNYNKVPRPAVVFVSGGKARVVVRRETEEDLLRLDL